VTSAVVGGGTFLSWRIERGNWAFGPGLTFGGIYQVGDQEGMVNNNFIGAEGQGPNFMVSSAETSEFFGRFGAQFLIKPGFLDVGVGLAYDGAIGAEGLENAIRFRLAREF
jgi:hypothetical protein